MKERQKERRKLTKQWNVTSKLAELVDTAVGPCKNKGRFGLGIADKRMVALLEMSGYKVDTDSWTMVKLYCIKFGIVFSNKPVRLFRNVSAPQMTVGVQRGEVAVMLKVLGE